MLADYSLRCYLIQFGFSEGCDVTELDNLFPLEVHECWEGDDVHEDS